MLPKTAAAIGAALDATEPAAVEAKLDVAHLQVHVTPAGMSIFTRNLLDVSVSIPDAVRTMMERMQRFPFLFIGHGSPMNAVEGDIGAQWAAIGAGLDRPNAIVAV